MRVFVTCVLLLASLYSGMAKLAFAAEPQAPPPPSQVVPSTKMATLPAFESPVEQKPFDLILPPSKSCTAADLPGLWRLMQVYEAPTGFETQAFNANPIQYIYFQDQNLFGKYNAASSEMKPDDIRSQISGHATGLQYIAQDNGYVFFYQDRIATDTQACFIVVNEKNPFTAGQMLLMPPKGAISGRLVKGYVKIWSPPTQPAANKPPPLRLRRGHL